MGSMTKAYLVAVALVALAAPVAADVKAGVEAWSRGEYVKAVAEWRGPALAGDADAQFNMGQAYKLGRGVPVDLPVATEWFRKAAVQGHAQAQDNYGLALFQEGKKAEAAPWLEKGAARDEKRTELVLGTMLFNGDGVVKDWTRGYALVLRSSQQGLPQGSQTLAQMDEYIPAAQRQQGIALARQMETAARAAAIQPQPGMRATEVPPSNVAGAGYAPPAKVAAVKPPPAPSPKPAVAPAAKTAPPAPAPKPAVAAPATGGWRVQLGAFGNEANARALWAKVGARVGGSPAYVKAGAVTRLQATGFASKAAAQAACAKAGGGCIVVGP